MTDTKDLKDMVDPSDIQFNFKAQRLEFYHVPTSKFVKFKAYLTEYKDHFESNWEPVEVYGRMDDIQMFKGTKRRIDIGWQVVARNMTEALSNLRDCGALFKMLYPTYKGSKSSSSTLKAPPLLRLKFANLIQAAEEDSVASDDADDFPDRSGLLGVADGFAFAPDLDAGFFDPGVGNLIPKVIDLSCTFSVLHTEDVGWDSDTKKWLGSDNYPYIIKIREEGPFEAIPSPFTPKNTAAASPTGNNLEVARATAGGVTAAKGEEAEPAPVEAPVEEAAKFVIGDLEPRHLAAAHTALGSDYDETHEKAKAALDAKKEKIDKVDGNSEDS